MNNRLTGVNPFTKSTLSMEQMDKDRVEPQPKIAVYIPEIDDAPELFKSTLWGGYDLSINRLDVLTHNVSVETSQQLQHHELQQHLKEDAEEDEAAIKDYVLVVGGSDQETDLSAVVAAGKASGVYLTDPATAYSDEFLEELSAQTDLDVHTNTATMERYLDARLHKAKVG